MQFIIRVSIPRQQPLYFSKTASFDRDKGRARPYKAENAQSLAEVQRILKSRFNNLSFASMTCWGGASFESLTIEFVSHVPTAVSCAAA